jgi:KipI family sensor histidine kinase inhibitor
MIVGTDGVEYGLYVTPLAESALLFRIGAGESYQEGVVDTVTALTVKLDTAWLPGVRDVVPAYCTIMIEFDPLEVEGQAVAAWVRAAAEAGLSGEAGERRLVLIPVVYGGDYGPDLPEVATELGLSPAEVIAKHAESEYRVACMGFAPGWAYLTGLDPVLNISRRQEPRTRIPAGTVAMGGGQTGVYPLETPGGWRMIGRTPLAMFDPERDGPFLLRQGDRVRFAPIDEQAFLRMKRTGHD